MSTYALNGSPIQSVVLKLPQWGVWTARVKLASDNVLAHGAAAVIVLGDLTLAGTVRAGGVFSSSAEYIILGGKDGWAGPVAKRSYRTDTGVKLSQVATDLGIDAGERVALLPGTDRSVGYAYARAAGTGAEALDALGTPWHVGSDGITYLGERIGLPLPKAAKWSVESYDPARRMAVIGIANDALAAWQPGTKVKGNGIDLLIGSVVVRITDRRIALEVWGT
jgi:hypothetical protein